MAISYDKLWKLLIDKKTKKTTLREITGVSSSTMAKLSKNQPVSLSILEKICAELECNIGDVMEFQELDQIREELRQKGN